MNQIPVVLHWGNGIRQKFYTNNEKMNIIGPAYIRKYNIIYKLDKTIMSKTKRIK